MSYEEISVLVIDDDPTTRRIVTRLIKQIGFTTFTEAGNGEEAFAQLESTKFGLILSDWDMPVMNGLQLLEKVRSDERFQDLPFIMITANDAKENILKAVRAKVSQYIVKPFTAPALREKIDKVLKIAPPEAAA